MGNQRLIVDSALGNIKVVYKWYILPNGGLYITYHLLREPGNSIDNEALFLWGVGILGGDFPLGFP